MLVSAIAAAFALPAVAGAATRYATPAGSGPAASCPEANPCSLRDAVNDASVADGDVIVVLPGEYTVADRIGSNKAISVHGTSAAARPVLRVTGLNSIGINHPDAVLADLEIHGPPSVPATATDPGFVGVAPLNIAAGTAERLYVDADTNFACELGSLAASPALLRDSVCWNYRPDGAGVALNTFAFGLGLDYAARLVNVTAVGMDRGVVARAHAGGTSTIEAVNVIARSDPGPRTTRTSWRRPISSARCPATRRRSR